MVTKTPFPFLRLSCCPLQDMTAFYTHLGSFMPVFFKETHVLLYKRLYP